MIIVEQGLVLGLAFSDEELVVVDLEKPGHARTRKGGEPDQGNSMDVAQALEVLVDVEPGEQELGRSF